MADDLLKGRPWKEHEIKLIEEIKRRSPLYEIDGVVKHGKEKYRLCWKEVAEQVRLPVLKCQTKWNDIKVNYEHDLRLLNKGKEAASFSKYLDGTLDFLKLEVETFPSSINEINTCEKITHDIGDKEYLRGRQKSKRKSTKQKDHSEQDEDVLEEPQPKRSKQNVEVSKKASRTLEIRSCSESDVSTSGNELSNTEPHDIMVIDSSRTQVENTNVEAVSEEMSGKRNTLDEYVLHSYTSFSPHYAVDKQHLFGKMKLLKKPNERKRTVNKSTKEKNINESDNSSEYLLTNNRSISEVKLVCESDVTNTIDKTKKYVENRTIDCWGNENDFFENNLPIISEIKSIRECEDGVLVDESIHKESDIGNMTYTSNDDNSTSNYGFKHLDNTLFANKDKESVPNITLCSAPVVFATKTDNNLKRFSYTLIDRDFNIDTVVPSERKLPAENIKTLDANSKHHSELEEKVSFDNELNIHTYPIVLESEEENVSTNTFSKSNNVIIESGKPELHDYKLNTQIDSLTTQLDGTSGSDNLPIELDDESSKNVQNEVNLMSDGISESGSAIDEKAISILDVNVQERNMYTYFDQLADYVTSTYPFVKQMEIRTKICELVTKMEQ